MNIDQCFNLGYVVKAIGLKGDCSIHLDVDDASRYKKLESVFIEINKQLVPFFIESIVLKPNNFAQVKFKSITTQMQAEQLAGNTLFLPLSLLPPLDENSFYFHELEGYTIHDALKGNIGVIREVTDYGSSMVASTLLHEKEILVPLQSHFVKKINRTDKILYTELPEGLVDMYLTHDPDEREEEQ
ncbi:MAG TPA: ribosome maturation factor RimM [Flavobacteriales bacterium]|nr:ribosome maturation factor RimM [Flavobacteriales bacterium]